MDIKVIAIRSNRDPGNSINYNIGDIFTTSYDYDNMKYEIIQTIPIKNDNGGLFFVKREDFMPLSKSRIVKISNILNE